MNPKHRDFIKKVADGVKQSEAYRISVGRDGISKTVCEVKGSQLAKKYAKEIEQERKRVSDIIDQATDNEVVENAFKDVLSKAERMKYLSNLVLDKSGKIITGDKIKAIAELNKMDGSYAPTQVKSDNTTTIQWSEERTYIEIDETHNKANTSN